MLLGRSLRGVLGDERRDQVAIFGPVLPRVADRIDGDAGVERGRLQLGVAEQDLDHADVNVLFEQVSGEAVAQGVRRTRLAMPAACAAA